MTWCLVTQLWSPTEGAADSHGATLGGVWGLVLCSGVTTASTGELARQVPGLLYYPSDRWKNSFPSAAPGPVSRRPFLAVITKVGSDFCGHDLFISLRRNE